MREQQFCDLPSLVQFSDQVRLGHEHVFEERLAEWRTARDQGNGRGRNAGTLHIEEQKTDSLVFGYLWIGAHEAENPVGFVSVRSPDLGAIDQEMIALVLRARLQRC